MTHPNELRPNDPPERVDMDALKRSERTILRGLPNDRNEPTRESRANELHGRARKPTSGHNLAFLDTSSFARTTRPNELRKNDPPEWVETDSLKRPDRTILRGRPNDRNEPTRES